MAKTTGSGAGAPSAGKKGVKRIKFRKPEIKGEVIYRNLNARPVKKGEKINFDNIEWLSARGEIGRGFAGVVRWAKLKFKGEAKPKRAVVKEYFDVADFGNVRGIIGRLMEEGSKVSCPKMDAAYANRKLLVVMEPFLKSVEVGRGKRTVVSKFFDAGKNVDLVDNLDLRKKGDVDLFRGVVKEIGELAKLRLWISPAQTPEGRLRMDVFNALPLKSGKSRVFVQDLDTVHASRSLPIKNWTASMHNLMLVVGQKEGNVETASKIIEELEEEYFGK